MGASGFVPHTSSEGTGASAVGATSGTKLLYQERADHFWLRIQPPGIVYMPMRHVGELRKIGRTDDSC